MQERRAKRRLNSRGTRRNSVRSDIFRRVWKAGHVMNSCALPRWPSFITNHAVLKEGTTFSARVAKHLSSVLLLNLNFFRPRKFVSIAQNPFHSPWINICVLLRSFGPWTLVSLLHAPYMSLILDTYALQWARAMDASKERYSTNYWASRIVEKWCRNNNFCRYNN